MSTNLTGKRIAVYARYSSANQREASLEDQVRRCREHVERHGGAVDEAMVFTDAAVSGASLQRAGFEAMMALIDRRAVDVVVTEDISRISRDLADGAALFKRLQYLDVPLIGVADGVDTSAKAAKVTFTIKNLVSDLYLEDLREKTLRGLEGRALAGYSTGGLPYGYRSEPQADGRGGVVGYRVVIDEKQAAVVRRIFTAYLDGRSLSAIAGALNAECVAPPRSKRRRFDGWMDSTVRAVLHNEAYVGVSEFKRREWRKVPGSNKRRYRTRPESEVIRREYPERRIVDAETWAAVQARLVEVRAKYKKGAMEKKAPGNRTAYPLSGLLFCATCGSSMVITGGSSARYYVCSAAKQRRTCPNRSSVREDVTRQRVLGAIREQLTSAGAIEYLRKRIAERLGELARNANRELDERRARLDRTEGRIRGLVEFIAQGDHSQYVRDTLRDLEAQAVTEKREIEAVVARSKTPVRLPTAAEILAKSLDLETVLVGDPVRGREALRALFEDGRITLQPGPDGTVIAEAVFLPLVAISSGLGPRGASEVAGAMPENAGDVTTALRLVIKKPPDRRRRGPG